MREQRSTGACLLAARFIGLAAVRHERLAGPPIISIGICHHRDTRKVFQCIRCKRQVSLTAGTLLEHTKLPLTTWYLAIYLLTQSKNGISAMDLMRQLGVSYNTAWMLKHKLLQAIRERDDGQPLGGFVELDDAYLGGEASGGKRGRGADRKTPILAAARVTEDGRPQRLRLSPVVGFRRRAV